VEVKNLPVVRREMQLILCCAAANPQRDERLCAIINTGVDWEVVLHSAARQGVLPLVYRALAPSFVPRLPASVRERLHREVHGNTLRNHYLANEMVRIWRLLRSNGVSALALKGPVLAVGAYGDLASRQFADLDLLVRPAELNAACAALAGDGYRTKMPLKRRGQAAGWEATFARSGELYEIDLHWRLSPRYFAFAPEGDELWARAVEVELGTGRVLTLGPQDLMLFLCAHGAKHGWQSLSGVCDVAQAARAYECDWQGLYERARALGNSRILLLGALLAYELLAAPIPETLIAAARADSSVRRAAHTFYRYFYLQETGGPGLHQRWSVPLAMIEHRSARLRYLLARALLPATRDFDIVSLPSTLSALYYAVRPLRLVWQKRPWQAS
jgi:hypothetical protein